MCRCFHRKARTLLDEKGYPRPMLPLAAGAPLLLVPRPPSLQRVDEFVQLVHHICIWFWLQSVFAFRQRFPTLLQWLLLPAIAGV